MANPLYQPDATEEPILGLASVSILQAAPLGRLSFRGRKAAQDTAAKALGFDLPQKPLSAAEGVDKAALWLGPDEWLLLTAEDGAEALQTAMADTIGNAPHALVDISHRQDALIVTGDRAEWLLNSGIPIDLDRSAFPVGMVTRTLFHKAPVMLWRIGDDSFVIEAWGTFMGYVAGLLEEAATELTAA
ncbi:sarcosine oxidase subunit gamma family protein [uncultured Roseibium sp.]|uniref:sarcosine oxidase subunit gamma n=1 Tax=uncultured Roseibium sp. TaxID=1936171 RepID=UPI003216DCA7